MLRMLLILASISEIADISIMLHFVELVTGNRASSRLAQILPELDQAWFSGIYRHRFRSGFHRQILIDCDDLLLL